MLVAMSFSRQNEYHYYQPQNVTYFSYTNTETMFTHTVWYVSKTICPVED